MASSDSEVAAGAFSLAKAGWRNFHMKQGAAFSFVSVARHTDSEIKEICGPDPAANHRLSRGSTLATINTKSPKLLQTGFVARCRASEAGGVT